MTSSFMVIPMDWGGTWWWADEAPGCRGDGFLCSFTALFEKLSCLNQCLGVFVFLAVWICDNSLTLIFWKSILDIGPESWPWFFLDPAVVPWFSQRTKPPFTEFAGKIHEFSSMLPTFSNDIPISWWLWHRKNLPWTLADFHHGASLAQAGRPSKNFTWFDPIRWNFATRRLWGSEDFFPVDIVWIITSP